ncbi:mitochondrial substrate carrier [Haematococcus lacustris]
MKTAHDQSWTHSVAGATAGSVAVLVLHPFDVIKTRLQVQDGHQSTHLTYQGVQHAVRSMRQQEGWRAFYRGLTPALLGSGISWSAYFTAYEALKSWHLQWLGGERLAPHWHTLSAAEAGALVCLVTNPIWLIKTRLQLQTSTPAPHTPSPAGGPLPSPALMGARAAGAAAGGVPVPSRASQAAVPGAQAGSATGRPYRSFLDALLRIGREEGLRGLYKGLLPSLLLQTSHGAIQFTVYEELKEWTRRVAGPGQAQRSPSALDTSMAAAASKLAASLATYPTQVVRSRLQQRFDTGRSLQYQGSWDVARSTWRREGLLGFYRGLGPALVRVLPQSALTLLVYENMLRVLRGPGSGSGLMP